MRRDTGGVSEVQSTKDKGQSAGAGLLDFDAPILQHSNAPFSPGMDLVTVLAHELGHVLGHEDLDPASHPDHIMSATLGAGVERSVSSDRLSVISDQSSVMSSRQSAVSGQESVFGARRTGIDDVWSAFGDFDVADHAARRHAPPATLRGATDALFARLDERAGAMTG